VDPAELPYFTWKEKGLTEDCASLDAMASRFEEAAQLMRRMASEGFRVERIQGLQRITHDDEALFKAYGFISEESAERQLDLVLDETRSASH
jgi:hypothetical protein